MERLKAPFEPISEAQRLADTKAVEFKEKNNDKPTDEEFLKFSVAHQTPVNIFIHQILAIGSFMGVLTLPIWTILVGVRLFREKTK